MTETARGTAQVVDTYSGMSDVSKNMEEEAFNVSNASQTLAKMGGELKTIVDRFKLPETT